ncbi:MAG: hypothetical protein ACAI35_09675 [Candidatus Methylacidiphilales bacterium]
MKLPHTLRFAIPVLLSAALFVMAAGGVPWTSTVFAGDAPKKSKPGAPAAGSPASASSAKAQPGRKNAEKGTKPLRTIQDAITGEKKTQAIGNGGIYSFRSLIGDKVRWQPADVTEGVWLPSGGTLLWISPMSSFNASSSIPCPTGEGGGGGGGDCPKAEECDESPDKDYESDSSPMEVTVEINNGEDGTDGGEDIKEFYPGETVEATVTVKDKDSYTIVCQNPNYEGEPPEPGDPEDDNAFAMTFSCTSAGGGSAARSSVAAKTGKPGKPVSMTVKQGKGTGAGTGTASKAAPRSGSARGTGASPSLMAASSMEVTPDSGESTDDSPQTEFELTVAIPGTAEDGSVWELVADADNGASVKKSDGTASGSKKFKIKGPRITRDVAGGSVKWEKLEGDLREVLPGQKMTLKCETPSSMSVTKRTWEVAGKIFKDYVATKDSSELTNMSTGDKSGETITFYWADTGTARKVKCTLEVSGVTEPIVVETDLDVIKPGCTLTFVQGEAAVIQYTELDNGFHWYAGLFRTAGATGPNAGIAFTGKVTLDSKFGVGQWQWVQLVTMARMIKLFDDTWIRSKQYGTEVLDTQYPYNGPHSTDDPFPAYDTPRHPLPDSGAYKYLEVDNESFSMYLLFKPPGVDSRFVPLKVVHWFWSISAQYVPPAVAGDPGTWDELDFNQGSSTSAVETSDHPMWDEVVTKDMVPF